MDHKAQPVKDDPSVTDRTLQAGGEESWNGSDWGPEAIAVWANKFKRRLVHLELRAFELAGIPCPYCGHNKHHVYGSRIATEGGRIRYRKCLFCTFKFKTIELWVQDQIPA